MLRYQRWWPEVQVTKFFEGWRDDPAGKALATQEQSLTDWASRIHTKKPSSYSGCLPSQDADSGRESLGQAGQPYQAKGKHHVQQLLPTSVRRNVENT